MPPATQPQRQVLRDYQSAALSETRTLIRDGAKSVLLVSGTGTGKTTIAAAMIDGAAAKAKRVLFLAHRTELIDQCSARLMGLGVRHRIIKADHPARRPWLKVHVASVQTLVRRDLRDNPDLIFVDEAHHATAGSYQKILSRFPGAICIGLTATPIRTDGKPLGSLFKAMVQCPGVAEMIQRGYLVPTRVFAPKAPDVSGVKTTGGDYNQGQLAAVVDQGKLIGNIVEHWQRLGENRQTVVFAVNVAHSRHIVEKFRAAGVAAEHLDGTTPAEQRSAILARLASGRTLLVSNCGVLTEGWDSPVVSCCILARPTQSLALYLQMAGRVLRPHPESGKKNAILLDHAGCTMAHGFVDDDREWSLSGSPKRKGAAKQVPDLTDNIKVCPECELAWGRTKVVCDCGYVFSVRDAEVKEADGQLEEVVDRKRYTIHKLSHDPAVARLQKIAAEKQYKPGWVHIQREALNDARRAYWQHFNHAPDMSLLANEINRKTVELMQSREVGAA